MAKAKEKETGTEVETTEKSMKEILEERISRGDFRIVRNYKFKDGGKKLNVDYKDTFKNYFLENNSLIEHFKELYPNQEFIVLE